MSAGGQDVDSILCVFRLEAPLPTGQFMSFFSVIKRVFDSLSDLKGELNKVRYKGAFI